MIQMWNDILQFYKNYAGGGYLLALFAAAWIYLVFKEKNKQVRAVLIFAPLTVLALFSLPPFMAVFHAVGMDKETYYRILWIVPMGIVTAYAGARLFGKYTWLSLGVSAVLVALAGKYVYSSQNINIWKAENRYHIPQMVINVCDVIEPEEEGVALVWAVFPSEFIHYVRQYSSSISMPYGREALVDRWGFDYELMDLMEAETIRTSELAEHIRLNWCEYVVLSENKVFTEPMEEYGFELIDTVDGYRIYRDAEKE